MLRKRALVKSHARISLLQALLSVAFVLAVLDIQVASAELASIEPSRSPLQTSIKSKPMKLPAAFWPSIDVWYWGGACYICRLAMQLAQLRLEQFRVRRLRRNETEKTSNARVQPPLDLWRNLVCDDAVFLVVQASAELGGSFLRHLGAVLSSEYPAWRPEGATRDALVAWLSELLLEDDLQQALQDGSLESQEQWPFRYRHALSESTRLLCHRLWARHVVPALSGGHSQSPAGTKAAQCSCIEGSEPFYQGLEQDRMTLVSWVYPRPGLWGLCEHLAPILDAWRTLRKLLPPGVDRADRLHNASCALAGVFWQPPEAWRLNAKVRLDLGARWFGLEEVSPKASAFSRDCRRLAQAMDEMLSATVREARGIVPGRDVLEGRKICPRLTDVPLESQLSTIGNFTLAAWYFSQEGLVEELNDNGETLYRAAVPLSSEAHYVPVGLQGYEMSRDLYLGPWHRNISKALANRRALYEAQNLLGGSEALQQLLRLIDESLIFYHGAAVEAMQNHSNLTFVTGDVVDFELLRRHAAGNVVSEIAQVRLPFEMLCASLVEPERKLRWLGLNVLDRWCRDAAIIGQQAQNLTTDSPSMAESLPEAQSSCVSSSETSERVVATALSFSQIFAANSSFFREALAWVIAVVALSRLWMESKKAARLAVAPPVESPSHQGPREPAPTQMPAATFPVLRNSYVQIDAAQLGIGRRPQFVGPAPAA